MPSHILYGFHPEKCPDLYVLEASETTNLALYHACMHFLFFLASEVSYILWCWDSKLEVSGSRGYVCVCSWGLFSRKLPNSSFSLRARLTHTYIHTIRTSVPRRLCVRGEHYPKKIIPRRDSRLKIPRGHVIYIHTRENYFFSPTVHHVYLLWKEFRPKITLGLI